MIIRMLVVMLAISLITKGQEPVKINFQSSASFRWLNKEILENKILDDMESPGNWTPFTTGAISVVDARITADKSESKKMVTEMGYTAEKSHSGNQSLRIKFPSKLDLPGPKSGRGWGTAGITRTFENEDWTKFNRISIWIHPDCPGHYQTWLEIRLFNEGSEKLPALFGQEGETTVTLKNQTWNRVLWEIGNVARDKISKLEISIWMAGNEPEASDTMAYYFDDLELQKVSPDYIEGWKVWPGRISFSHTGYQTDAPKSAIANDLTAGDFKVIDASSGKIVLSKAVKTIAYHLGTFQLLDFSEITQSGAYYIEAGGTKTQTFPIDPGVWEETIWKALNFFYVERCGTPVAGAHGSCHRDWTCIHDDKRIVINGGWHDAGDFTQGLRNTGEAVYAMFSLAEQLKRKGGDQKLFERLVEEARWGLDWILKTRFGDGFRNEGSVNSRRTNGIIGDFDDVSSTARNTPKSNFVASASEAIGYRILKDIDPRIADYSLKTARQDWQFAVEKMDTNPAEPSKVIWSGSFDSGNILHDVASSGILASVELWRATGDSIYAIKAAELSKIIIESQQRKIPEWDVPLTGFFYTGPARDHILHYCHNGRENEPIVALAQLCEAFPGHPDWMKWYSAIVLHSEYLKAISAYTGPYNVMPSSIYTDQEYLEVPESRRESFRKQVLNGIPLGKGHYLRLFPVWMDYRGHFGTILPQALSLTYAARVRGDLESANLARHQMEWIVGRNPFSQSTMYGVGYDFPPLYTPSSGDIVGALPVGIQTRNENDAPYWPVQNTWTYKEVWVHPVSQWIWLMRDIEGSSVTKNPDLHQDKAFSFEVTKTRSAGREVIIRVKALGSGSHSFKVRAYNLTIKSGVKQVNLRTGREEILEWRGKINSPDEQWVVVIVPDNDLTSHKELIGSARDKD